MKPLIELKDIQKSYFADNKRVTVLKAIHLKIFTGETISLLGKSGSGKSTFMNILGCLDRPCKGQYLFEGVDILKQSETKKALFRSQNLGFVFQNFNLIPQYSAFENVQLPLLYQGFSTSESKEKVLAALEKVELQHRVGHKATQLSGGECQRVAIARALVCDTKLILADEPTGNLDSKTAESIFRVFKMLRAESKTLVYVTHDLNFAKKSDRIFQIEEARMQALKR